MRTLINKTLSQHDPLFLFSLVTNLLGYIYLLQLIRSQKTERELFLKTLQEQQAILKTTQELVLKLAEKSNNVLTPTPSTNKEQFIQTTTSELAYPYLPYIFFGGVFILIVVAYIYFGASAPDSIGGSGLTRTDSSVILGNGMTKLDKNIDIPTDVPLKVSAVVKDVTQSGSSDTISEMVPYSASSVHTLSQKVTAGSSSVNNRVDTFTNIPTNIPTDITKMIETIKQPSDNLINSLGGTMRDSTVSKNSIRTATEDLDIDIVENINSFGSSQGNSITLDLTGFSSVSTGSNSSLAFFNPSTSTTILFEHKFVGASSSIVSCPPSGFDIFKAPLAQQNKFNSIVANYDPSAAAEFLSSLV